MRAVILVGGLGTRLRPLTNQLPKPLVPIAGEALMSRTLRRLQRQGVRHVILAVQYLAEQFLAAYGDGSAFGLDLQIVQEPEPLGTAGAVRYALAQTKLLEAGPILVLNGDELTDFDVAQLWQAHAQAAGVATIAVREVADTSAFGVVASDEQQRVYAFQEKPAPGTALANTINSGAYVFAPAALAQIPAHGFAMLERDLFPTLLAAQAPIYAYQHNAYSQDIGTLAGYLAANEAVLIGRLPQEPVHGIQYAAGVWAAADAQISPSAQLIAPIMLGSGCVVGEQARLERVVAWERVTIEAAASLTNVALASDVLIAHHATVEGLALG
ncbi:sugar phosphate nucleotidyltransferase [Herpetosiphon llansteffanensis]